MKTGLSFYRIMFVSLELVMLMVMTIMMMVK